MESTAEKMQTMRDIVLTITQSQLDNLIIYARGIADGVKSVIEQKGEQ